MSFNQIKHRTLKQLAAVYPKLQIKPNIRKSNLRSLYRAIQCQSIKSNQIRELSDMKLEELQVTGKSVFKKIQQILTTYINLLQHNQKIRQYYEVTILNTKAKNQAFSKSLKQIFQQISHVSSKSQFLQFISKKGQSQLFNSTDLFDKNNEWKQIYILGSTNAYVNVDKIDQDQYLVYHQDVLQKLLVFVNMINKQIHKLEGPEGSSSLNQLVKLLSSDEIFRTNNNKFTQLINFILLYVTQNSSKVDKKRKQLNNSKKQLQSSILRNYYMQFMSRKQINTVSQYLKDNINSNRQFLKQLKQKNGIYGTQNQTKEKQKQKERYVKQKKDIIVLRNKMKEISDYLCDKQEKILSNFYQRKIKKVMIVISEVWNVISFALKINRRISERLQKLDNMDFRARESESDKKQIKLLRQSKLSKKSIKSIKSVQEKKNLQQRIQLFIQKFQAFRNNLEEKKFILNSQEFQSFFNMLQQYQIQLNQINIQHQQKMMTQSYSQNQRNNKQINQKEQITHVLTKLSQDLLQYQRKIILNSKKNLNLKQKLMSTKIIKNNRQSHLSKTSTVFNDFSLDQNQIFLRKPDVTQSAPQKIKYDEFVRLSQEVLNSIDLKFSQILEDMQFIDVQKLNNCIWQAQNNKQMIEQKEEKPIIKQEPQKNEKLLLPPKAGQQKLSKSPQKSPKKQQKPIKKLDPKLSNKKQPPQQLTAQKLQKQKQIQKQTIIKDYLLKLNLIKQLIIPQISQALIPKIFYGNVHTQLFIYLYESLSKYKERLTGLTLSIAAKSTYEAFYNNRLRYVNTILKNMPSFIQILKFIRILSENKLKLDPTQESTYNFILKAILAQKQIQAYRMESQDLAFLKDNLKISTKGIELVEDNIYKPFMSTLKQMFKIPHQKNMIVQMVSMLDFCKDVSAFYIKAKNILQQLMSKISTQGQKSTKQQLKNQLKQIHKNLLQKLRAQEYVVLRMQKVKRFLKYIQKLLQLLSGASNKNGDKIKKLSKQILQQFAQGQQVMKMKMK